MVFFADFETRTNETESRVNLGYIESLNGNKNLLFLTIEEMFNFLPKIRATITVYFHNLSYDGEYIIWWLVENGFKPEIMNVNNSNSFKERTDFYGAKQEIYINYNSRKIRILCSYKLWPVKLEKIGESLGFPKLKIDFSKYQNSQWENIKQVPQELKDYVIRDVQILKKKYIQFSAYYPIKKTASSSSWKVFKNWWKEKYGEKDFRARYSIGEMEHDYFNFAYWGGYNNFKKEYENKLLKGTFYWYDLNSSYAAIFVEELLPYGAPLDKKPSGDYVAIIDAIITDIKMIDTRMMPHLHNWARERINKDNTYITNSDKVINVMYTEQEWREIKKTYSFKTIREKWTYFKADRKLGEYINELYKLKENETDPVKRKDHKQILNTFTGKWGQSRMQYNRYLREATPEDEHKYKYGNYVYDLVQEQTKEIKYIPIVIFVTSLARVKLLRTIRANYNIFAYSDTDSIILTKKPDADGIIIDDNKIGYWKLVAQGTDLKILKQKTYLMKLTDGTIKKTLAGINKECHYLFNFDNFEKGTVIENGNFIRKKVKGGFKIIPENITL